MRSRKESPQNYLRGWWGWGGSTLALLSLGPESPSLPQIPQPVSSPQPCHGLSVMRPDSLKVSGFPQPQRHQGRPQLWGLN